MSKIAQLQQQWLALLAVVLDRDNLVDFVATYDDKTWLASDSDNSVDGLSVRDAEAIRDRRPPAVTVEQARTDLAKWAKSHDSQIIGDGAYSEPVGPWETSWKQYGWEMSEIETPWGVDAQWDFVLKEDVTIIGYQAPDGRERCTQRNDNGALCDAVLDSGGHCPACGYSTIWNEENLAERENAKEYDRLERRMAKSLNAAYKAERFERLSKIRHWFANAPLDRVDAGRNTFYKKVIASRKMAAKTGLWYRQYLTKNEVDSVFAVIEYRKSGGEAIGSGAPTATPAPDAPKPREVSVLSDNMTMAQAQWALDNRPSLVERKNLSKVEHVACIKAMQAAWPVKPQPLTHAEFDTALADDAWQWAPVKR